MEPETTGQLQAKKSRGAVAATSMRVLLGLVFMFSGIVKAIDPTGTQIKFSDYIAGMGLGLDVPTATLLVLACLLAGFEILLGSYLVMGAFRRGTALTVLVLMCILTPFTLYVALTDSVHDCGCFGDALVLTNWQTFAKNVVLLALAVFVFVKRESGIRFVGTRYQWIVTVAMVLVSVRFMFDNVNMLPAVDFRPYRIGTDIRKQVLESGNPEFEDFFLMDSNLDDVTQSVLSRPGYTFLIVSPHLEEADCGDIDRLDDIADYCGQYGYGLYCITASGREEIDSWKDYMAAKYTFLSCDEIPLKTMIRSNPGLVLLKDGVVSGKWSHAGMPDESRLTRRLEDAPELTRPNRRPMAGPFGVTLLFALPLVIIGLLDSVSKKILSTNKKKRKK